MFEDPDASKVTDEKKAAVVESTDKDKDQGAAPGKRGTLTKEQSISGKRNTLTRDQSILMEVVKNPESKEAKDTSKGLLCS